MRVAAFFTSAVLVSTAYAYAQTRTGPPRTGLSVGYDIAGYFGDYYTAPPQQMLVYFPGEPITFNLQVGNLGPAAATLNVETTEPQRLFQVQALKAPRLLPGAQGDRPVSIDGRRFLDELDVSVPVTFSSSVKTWSGGSFDLQLQRETVLEVGDAIQWVMTVVSADLEPGLYRLYVRVNGTDRGQPLPPAADMRFEVRPRTADAEPEILRREAERRLSRNDHNGARDAAAALLKLHPNSVYAYALLGTIADREGEKDAAAVNKQRASAILKSGQDELLVKYKRQGRVID